MGIEAFMRIRGVGEVNEAVMSFRSKSVLPVGIERSLFFP